MVRFGNGFVERLGPGGEGAAMMMAMIGLGRDLGLEVVSEGIETAAQLARLTELGCTAGQGYLIGRPVEAHAAAEILEPLNGHLAPLRE